MKKIFTLLVGALCSLSALATTFNFNSKESVSQTIGGYTVTIAKGSGTSEPAYYDNGLRLYAKNTITVSGPDLTNISLTFSMQGTKEYASLTASAGNLVSGGVSTSSTEKVTDTWSGSASSVTFTLGATGQRLIYGIVVNGDGSENPGGNDNPSQPSDPETPTLDPDFVYPEPTVLTQPAVTVQGEAYTFVDNNIMVSCTKGAVNSEYFSAHAGFDMTFTATRPIKGIVINGWVKTDFTATANHGDITYLSPSMDMGADPVVVIRNIDSKEVTISCVKQLRCYNVEVYFDENPEATVSGGTGDGEEVTLDFDSAEAVYESEYVEMLGEENYSVFLFNAASPDVPYFALDIFPASKDNLAGTYYWDDMSLGDFTYYVYGYGEYDITWAESGEVTISKSGDVYTITGTIKCDNTNTYNISFTGKMPIYLDEDYYGDGGVGAVNEVIADTPVSSDRSYDLNGRIVSKGYRGIVIRGGKKEIIK